MGRDTIFIIDDHPLVIEAVGQAISTAGDFHVISASSATEMRAVLDSAREADLTIRLIFLDMRLPDADGLDLIPMLTSRYGIPVIAIAGGDEDFVLNACIKKGASGFIRKSSDLSTFSSALRIVLEGGLYFPTEYINGKKLSGVNLIANLSDRQRQVLDLMLMGRSNKQIGDEVYLAEGTVKNKVSELLSIFNVQSRAQLIFEVSRIGYKPGSSMNVSY